MDDQEDPALQFFPDGNVDLYATLGIDKSATSDEIKKAYKKLALKFHPDKVLSSSTTAAGSTTAASAEETILKFQCIGFAYAVLSDQVRRNKYDATGSTRELGIGEGVDDFDWNEYFKTLWTGEVSKKTLEVFKQKYQNSPEEKEDIIAAYRETDGSLESIFASVPCSEFLADEQRFIDIVEALIDSGELERKSTWNKTSKDKTSRAKLRKKAEGEAKEAEKLARELGVWDDLFGDQAKKAKGNAKAAKRTIEDTSDEEEGEKEEGDKKANAPGSSSGGKKGSKAHPAKSKGSSNSNSKKKGSTTAVDNDDADLAGLKVLMRRKASNRANAFDDMIAKLEAKSGAKKSRPSDEEFDRIQREMLQRRNNAGDAGKRKASALSSSASSSLSKTKKSKR